jgi:hypothetical protein
MNGIMRISITIFLGLLTCGKAYIHQNAFIEEYSVVAIDTTNAIIIEQNDTKTDVDIPIRKHTVSGMGDTIKFRIYSSVTKESYTEDGHLYNAEIQCLRYHDSLYIVKTDKLISNVLAKQSFVPAPLPPIETNIDSVHIWMDTNMTVAVSVDYLETFGSYLIEDREF